METARRHPDEPNGCGSCADGSSACTDVHSIGNATETAANGTETVRTRRIGSRMQDSPNGREIVMPKRILRWRRVSEGSVDMYVPLNTPIAVPTRQIVFGRVESRGEAKTTSVEGERAGEGDGRRNGGDGDVGDTTSGGDANSMRVKAALLATKSQYTRYSRRTRLGNSPVSSRPPIQLERRLYGLVRRRRRRGRLKIERINDNRVSQTKQRETTHLGRAHAMQPPGNAPNRAYEVYRPRRRRGRIKIAPINVSRTREVENTYLGRDIALRSMQRPEKRIRRVNKLTFECRMQGERRRDDGDYG